MMKKLLKDSKILAPHYTAKLHLMSQKEDIKRFFKSFNLLNPTLVMGNG